MRRSPLNNSFAAANPHQALRPLSPGRCTCLHRHTHRRRRQSPPCSVTPSGVTSPHSGHPHCSSTRRHRPARPWRDGAGHGRHSTPRLARERLVNARQRAHAAAVARASAAWPSSRAASSFCAAAAGAPGGERGAWRGRWPSPRPCRPPRGPSPTHRRRRGGRRAPDEPCPHRRRRQPLRPSPPAGGRATHGRRRRRRVAACGEGRFLLQNLDSAASSSVLGDPMGFGGDFGDASQST